MGENSKIEWCDHTYNPWVGCTKVSPACDHCYAESWAKRAGTPELWQGERRRTSEANWRQPLKWNRDAERDGVRRKVFCASLADVFDNQVPIEWLVDLLDLIFETTHLDWLLLTKRPQNIVKRLREAADVGRGVVSGAIYQWLDGGKPPPNVWLGTTVENPDECRRIDHLRAIPAKVRFLSAEPLLREIRPDLTGIHWVICGSESGPKARPCDLDWVRSVRDQCMRAGTAFFWKQHAVNGRKIPIPELDGKQWAEFPL